VAAQIALARRDSPARGSRHVGLARALDEEMPHTMAHLTAGRISEWRAMILCRETACLSAQDRAAVDAALAADLPNLGDRQVEARARSIAARIDNAATAKRAARVRNERRVTIRPAPDTMTYLTALLPVEQGVAVFAALDAKARELVGDGDGRGRGQIMADTLVERVSGQASAPAVPMEIQLVMPAETLLGTGVEAAEVPGHGPLPAAFARQVLGRCLDAGAAMWLRRVFTSPSGRELVATDSRRRRFDGQLRQMLRMRDQSCRTPWCDAPIRHGDHASPSRSGGATTSANGQGLCEACNYAKEASGWRTEVIAPGPTPFALDAPAHHTVITTPTGHTYDSTTPPLLAGRLGFADPPGGIVPASVLERHLERLLAA
jgi:hypothetical protein